jgi:hypothetical protein
MSVSPTDTPVTSPFSSTVAMSSSSDSQVTFLFVASSGNTEATKVSVLQTPIVVDSLFNVTPVTGTTAGVTVTSQVSVLAPSNVLTVIVAVPSLTPVISPSTSTVTTDASLVDQATLLSVAL